MGHPKKECRQSTLMGYPVSTRAQNKTLLVHVVPPTLCSVRRIYCHLLPQPATPDNLEAQSFYGRPLPSDNGGHSLLQDGTVPSESAVRGVLFIAESEGSQVSPVEHHKKGA